MENQITSSENLSTIILPSKEEIDLNIIKEFMELDGKQKDFLISYAGSGLQKTLSLLRVGVSKYQFDTWQKSAEFNYVLSTINSLWTEALRSKHIEESYHNAKIRKSTLNALEAEGFESTKQLSAKNQQNIFLSNHEGINDLVKSLSSKN